MLFPESNSYNKDYYCIDKRIEQLFQKHNIIGVIHGHHHIPASSGICKYTTFAGKRLFVVCSIYSNLNTGFELQSLLPKDSNTNKLKHIEGSSHEYSIHEPISNVKGLSLGKGYGANIYIVDKVVNGIRHKHRVLYKSDGIRIINAINKEFACEICKSRGR